MTGAVISQNAAYFDFIADIHKYQMSTTHPPLNTFKRRFSNLFFLVFFFLSLKSQHFVPFSSMTF